MLDRPDLNLTITALTAGVDEAGRGPLAGPVIAAAVILPLDYDLPGLTDSKALSEQQRADLFEQITQCARSWSVGRSEPDEIDEINILWATMRAMERAINGLALVPEFALIDGNRCPEVTCATQAVIKGDTFVDCISAASIIAKQTRDSEMHRLDQQYPEYGFAQHKGYPTKKHLLALDQHGPCPIHRLTYKPVKMRIKN